MLVLEVLEGVKILASGFNGFFRLELGLAVVVVSVMGVDGLEGE